MISAGVEKLLVPAIISGPDWVMFPPALILRLPAVVMKPSEMSLRSARAISSAVRLSEPVKLFAALAREISDVVLMLVTPPTESCALPLCVTGVDPAVMVKLLPTLKLPVPVWLNEPVINRLDCVDKEPPL